MEKIFIYIENEKFPSVEHAAGFTTEIDWWDRTSDAVEICMAAYGAVDLKKHLCQLLHLEHNQVILTKELPTKGTVFVLGKAAKELLVSDVDSSAIHIKSWKREDVNLIVLAGNTPEDYLYAVVEYLQFWGIRWFSPGVKGTYIPPNCNWNWEIEEIKTEPKFITRGCYSEVITDDSIDFLDWMMHNRLNFAFMEKFQNPQELKKRGIGICAGGHVMLHQMLNPKQYFEKHPEWYAYVNGKRSNAIEKGDREGFGDNFCTSNLEAVDQLCTNIVESLRSGWLQYTDYLNFWMLDNGKWCECDACQSLGNYSYRLTKLVYQIDKRIKQANKDGSLNRNVKIMFPVYHETLPMPDQELPEDFDYESCIAIYFPIERCYVHDLNDPDCTETNVSLMNRLESWATKKDRTYLGDIFIGEYYNVGAYASISTCYIDIMKREIPFYYELGVRHMYYMHMTDKKWGSMTLLNYQLYQMLWNPNLNVEDLVTEYFELYYQNVAKEMESFYRTLEIATKHMKYFKHYQYSFEDSEQGTRLALSGMLNNGLTKEEELFPLKHMQFDTRMEDKNAGMTMVEIVALYQTCRELLDQAIMKAKDQTLSAILEEEDMRFTYTEYIVLYLYYMTRMSLQRGRENHVLAKNEFQKASMYAEKLRMMTVPTKGLLHFSQFENGLKATWTEAAYDNYKQIYDGE